MIHLSENKNEDNQDWVRNRLGPIINVFAISDEIDNNELLKKLFTEEKERAYRALNTIKEALDKMGVN
jgi:hypothetical protein